MGGGAPQCGHRCGPACSHVQSPGELYFSLTIRLEMPSAAGRSVGVSRS